VTLSRLRRQWLCEAVRLREEHEGLLEDGEANRRARAEGGDLPARIECRALLLANRDGLIGAQQQWLQGARLGLLLLALLALASGTGLAVAALGDGQAPVNVFYALGSLLGLNLLLLLGWLIGLLLGGHGAGLGRLWLWLSETLARDRRALHIAPALLLLLQRQRLNRWLLGLIVHGLWLLLLCSALLWLLVLLSTRRYGFVWESTLLDGDTFVALTQALGALPSLLGFALPDAATIRASADTPVALDTARHAWAGWLVGVSLVYGLLPRLLLALFCLCQWRTGVARLTLDVQLTGYSLLRQRLLPDSERLGVCDGEPSQHYQPQFVGAASGSQGALLVAVELDERHPWPPRLAAAIADAGVIDSREQRRQLLDQLVRFPQARLVIACDPRRSPDRGSLALFAELARYAASTRIWLLPPAPGEGLDSQRLGDWHHALDELQLAHQDSSPLTWLETGHD
jgi:hypothetical protein